MANRTVHVVGIVAAVVFIGSGNSQASGMPNHFAASKSACRILAILLQEWPALLDWYLAGDIKKLPPREVSHDPCRPVEPKVRARKLGR